MRLNDQAVNFFTWLVGDLDRRRGKRHAKPGISAYYCDWDGTISLPHEVREISESGAYLLTGKRWYPGTILSMTFEDRSQTGKGEALTLPCRVVRNGDAGVCLQFVPGDKAEQKNLTKLLSCVGTEPETKADRHH